MAHAYVSNSSDSYFGPAYEGNLRNFDFTLLFEDTILTIVPATTFLIAAAIRAVWLTSRPNKVTTSISRNTKLILLSAFSTIQLTVLLARATNLEIATKASVTAAALDFSAALILFVLSWFEHSRSVTPSTIIGLYLLISFPFDAVRLRTFYLIKGHAARGVANLLSISLAIKLGVLVTEAVEKRSILLEPYRDLPPEATSGLYNKSVFWWLNPLLRIGFSKTLALDDLFNLDETLSSSKIQDKFRQKWMSIKDHGRFSLLFTTVKILKWQLVIAAIPRLFISAVEFAQPFLVRETITYIGNKSDQKASIGWGLAGAYFCVYFALAILHATYQRLLDRIITQTRGGLISLLYLKTLDISITTNDTTASLTLMSSDVQRLVDAVRLVHDTWIGAIDVGVAMFLIYHNLGKTCYAPAVVYTLQVLGTSWITKVIAGAQKRWLEASQVRVSFTSALLHSIRNVKLLGMSSIVQNRTQGLRIKEIKECKRYRLINNFLILAQNSAGFLAPFATFLVYFFHSKSSGIPLDLGTAFSVLTILRLVESPLSILLYSVPALASSLSCFDRIQAYLVSESRHDNRLNLNDIYDSTDYWDTKSMPQGSIEMRRLDSISRSPASEALSLRHCSFGWKQDAPAVIKDVEITLLAGSVTMIIGPVGCGKSTLLKGILSETPLSSGFVYLRDQSIAFADQEPWIQNGTIMDTICGPTSRELSHENEPWYREVIHCCGLNEDLQVLPDGDKTLIGSKGISLSGGQKQRLALARAVYSRSELLVLDDVFSGLDNDTEELIFKRLFGRNGPLKRNQTTVILVTHAVHRLPYADLIVSLDDSGRISQQGSYSTLINASGYVHSLDIQFKEQISDEVEPPANDAGANKSSVGVSNVSKENEATQDLIRRTGEWSTYKHYFHAAGYIASVLSVVWGCLWICANQAPSILIQRLSDDSGTLIDGRSSRGVVFISALGATSTMGLFALIMIAWQIFLDMQPRSSGSLHLDLLKAVLNAPLSFFTRTDVGTIINRFSQDMALVDTELPFAYAQTVLTSVSCVAGLAVLAASGAGYFAATLPFVFAALYGVQKYYLRTSRQIRLLDLEEKAPLYTLFGETSAGLTSVRAFGWVDKFMEKNLELLDRSQRPFYLLFCIQRWLGLVLNFLVTALVTLLMIIVVAKRDSIDPGLVGIGLVSVVDLSGALVIVVRSWTDLETSIGAISRLRGFAQTTASEHKSTEVQETRKQWPEKGEVVFSGFGSSYSEESTMVLRNVELNFRVGEKVGICGRSGSGKSSMLASLFHLLEFRSGQILIDGVDIADIPRESLRAKLNVIPQEPWWLTTESVRFNLDPWNAANAEFDHPLERSETDTNFISVLSECQIWHVIEKKGGLDAVMTPDFLSHGQRQLFCLARAMVRRSKVVVLDEVSANVDVKTDELMQQIIRRHFHDCTVVTVAHRLNTIEDSDRIVVLSQGRVVEVGEPKKLLATTGSLFRELYEA